jgi:hypothetical protein
MNMFRRLALGSTMALSFGAVSLAQHYTQTNLQANTAGAAEATRSWSIPGVCRAPPAAPGGLQTMQRESLPCTTAQERNNP